MSSPTKTPQSLKELLDLIPGEKKEIFEQLEPGVRVFLVNHRGMNYGLFVNPPGRPNLFKTETVLKYSEGLKLFKKLKLPVFSFVDTPGADPRVAENDKGMIRELNELAMNIMDYPYFKMGVVHGRCYGGASIVCFPYFFGGQPVVALEGSNIGIMGNQIISKLLSSSKRLHAVWEMNAAMECDDLSDYVEVGLIEKVMSVDEFIRIFRQRLDWLRLGESVDAVIHS
jgi:acetyl-CoA carboxylase carboxyltransferase component